MVKIVTERTWFEDDITPGRKVVMTDGTHVIAVDMDDGAYFYVVQIEDGKCKIAGEKGDIANYLTAYNACPA